MLISDLKRDRFLRKDPNQKDQTKGGGYSTVNPAPKTVDAFRKLGLGNRSNEEDQGAPNVLTGTVITSCFIQTSALPSRVEIAGNDITFYDDTYVDGGVIKGDTSRLVFTHDLNSDEGFIMEKRSSINNTYDNVLSWYATPAKAGAHNYMFIGRDGRLSNVNRHVNSIHFNVDYDPDVDNEFLNGIFEVEFSTDGDFEANNHKPFIAGSSVQIFPGLGLTGFSSIIVGGDGGLSGLSYADPSSDNILVGLYMTSISNIAVGVNMIPDANGAYDLGSPSFKFDTIYGSVVACPLPTVENALEILEQIPEPVYVGERGHYGEDKKYFDDLTFPKEILFTNKKGLVDIEHNTMLGFLLKAVIELNEKVKKLEEQVQSN